MFITSNPKACSEQKYEPEINYMVNQTLILGLGHYAKWFAICSLQCKWKPQDIGRRINSFFFLTHQMGKNPKVWKPSLLVKLQRNRPSHLELVKLQNVTTSIKGNLIVSNKSTYAVTFWPNNCTSKKWLLRYTSRIRKYIDLNNSLPFYYDTQNNGYNLDVWL